MSSSFYTHIGLLISCVIFLFSLFSLIKRIQTDHHLTYSSTRRSIHKKCDDDHQNYTFTFEYRNLFNNLNDEQNENVLREKVLGANKTSQSILHRLKFFNPPKPICNYPKDTDNFLIILVLSRGLNFDFRQVIRATWGRNQIYKQNNIYVQTIFFVGIDDSVQYAVQDEQILFNDVVQIGVPETYPFVAHKELATLLWTRYYCPLARIIFRADDDVLLDIFLLLNQIQYHINFNENDGLYGWFRFNNTVHRADRWAVTKLEYKSRIYPPYTFGIGYLFSNKSCQRLIDAANHPQHQIIRIGDAYITGILRQLAEVPYYDFQNLDYAYTFYNEIPCDALFEKQSNLLICMSKLHIGKRTDPYEFYDIWDLLLIKHNISALDI